MLSKESIAIAIPLASKYAQQGKTIVAKPGSVVAELTSLSLNLGNVFISETEPLENQIPYISQDIEKATESTVQCPTPHSLAADRISSDISKYVAGHISFAKNVVKPVCEEVTKEICNFLENTVAKKAEQSISFIEYSLPDLLRDEEFLSSIAYADSRPALPPEKILGLPVKDREEIFQYLLTNQKATDELILPWASLLTGDFLQKVWTSFFTRVASISSGDLFSFDSIGSFGITQRIDIGLCLYLISTRLQAQVEKTDDDISLVKYNLYLSQMKDYAASLLWSSVNTFSMFEKTGTLIIGTGLDRKSVLVNEQVYKSFLQKGGTPECILGVVCSNRDLKSADIILSQKDDLEKTWQSYVVYFNAAEVNKRIEYFRDFIILKINSIVNGDKIKEVEEYRSENQEYDKNLKSKLMEYINNLTLSDLDCPADIGLEITGKCIFYFTDSYKILKGIEEAHKGNPNIDVREAALLSTISYISDFVADQLTVA